ncbi:HlyD family efflux transporter periplasmic adaptor subunit [Patescibacteria group bacterium]|nr:HlyD family efflux transporter periplasmic adaptor subunit [Patescibacteria group bacterium]
MDYLDYEERYESKSVTRSCLGTIVNLLFVIAICFGLYYGYIYLRDNVFNKDADQTTEDTQTEDEYVCGWRWDFWNSIDCEEDSNTEPETDNNDDDNTNTEDPSTETEDEVDDDVDNNEETSPNLQVSGNVYAYEVIDVKVSNAGTISDLNKSVGDTIKYGDKIATLITGKSDSTVSNSNYMTYVNQEKALVDQVNILYDEIYKAELAVRNAQIAHNNKVYGYNDSVQYYYNAIIAQNNTVIAAENRYLDAKELYYQATHDRYEVYISESEALRQMEIRKKEYEEAKSNFSNLESTRDINLNNYLRDIETAKRQIDSANATVAAIKPGKDAQIATLLVEIEEVRAQMNVTSTTSTITTTNTKEITSPITGKISDINVTNGTSLDYGETILTIEDLSKVKVVTYVKSDLLSYAKIGENALIEGPNDINYKGVITDISDVDSKTGKATVEIEVPNSSGKFTSGLTTNVIFTK